MKIECIDNFIEEELLKNRICKIRYSSAYENYLKEKLLLLRKKYNVFQMKDLFLEEDISEHKNGLNALGIGLLKNLLGLIPNYGAILTIIFSISDTIRFLKVSDIEKLKEKLQLKEKPHKKYKRIKNIIIVKNTAYLNVYEIDKIRFIQELIEKNSLFGAEKVTIPTIITTQKPHKPLTKSSTPDVDYIITPTTENVPAFTNPKVV